MLHNQLDTLSAEFAISYRSFNLRGVTHTVNQTWALDNSSQVDLEMKKVLRQGTYSTLNIYFLTSVLPKAVAAVQPGSSRFYRDGCLVLSYTVRVGGTTATHEVGHWFGLLQTFDGGCTGLGDMVDDTSAEASPSTGCNLTRNICPDQPGYDPVKNFMDYSPG